MATADQYAQWIVDNEDKKGTEDFNIVVRAYQEAKADESRHAQTSAKPEPSAAGNVAGAAATSAVGKLTPVNPYGTTLDQAGQAIKSGAQAVANKIGQTTLGGAGTLAADAYAALHGMPPLASIGRKVVQSVLPGSQTTIAEGLGAVGQGLKAGAGSIANAGKFIAQGAVAPENLMTLPYQMAAYEQDKIRANPNAPGLENNPYAQVQRNEYTTQAQAAAANRRQAIAGQQYGGLTPQEQSILAQEGQMAAQSNNWMARALDTAKQAAPTLQRYAAQGLTYRAPTYQQQNFQ
jgi:hypothetical protein